MNDDFWATMDGMMAQEEDIHAREAWFNPLQNPMRLLKRAEPRRSLWQRIKDWIRR